MNRNFKRQARWIRWALAIVLTLDLGLILFNWRAAVAPRSPGGQLERVRKQRDLLAADVRRATAIRQELSGAHRQFEEFFRRELGPVESGYSSVVADLGAIAKNAGLRTSAVTFRQHELSGRGVVEVEVAATVDGDYPSLVSFINGLERSGNFYVLDSLSLASSAGGNLKLNLQLRTYFRS